jgi:predicted GNAT family N-acyltransferase
MIPTDFHIEPADWRTDRDDLLRVRDDVFIAEQHVPEDEERDALDPIARHVLARDLDGQPIGTGRLVPPFALHGIDAPLPDGVPPFDRSAASIGRVAVLAAWRGRSIGTALMQALLDLAQAAGYRRIELHAQTHAIGFYERLGFVAEGDEFLDCDIPHRTMRRDLPAATPRDPPAPGPVPAAESLAAADRDQAIAATARVLTDARHELAICTRDLDPALFDLAPALDAIKRVALSGRHARVRILVQEPRKAVADGHRLIALAQRLPSTIAIRTPVEETDRQYAGAFVLNDVRGYFVRPLASRPEGDGSSYAPGRHAQLLEYFDQVWERSVPSEELRVLGV